MSAGVEICPHQRQRHGCKERRGGEHLPAPAPKERMQRVPLGVGHVDDSLEELAGPAHAAGQDL